MADPNNRKSDLPRATVPVAYRKIIRFVIDYSWVD